jgi:acyl-CoA hydrolase
MSGRPGRPVRLGGRVNISTTIVDFWSTWMDIKNDVVQTTKLDPPYLMTG